MSNPRLPYTDVLAARHALSLNAVRIIEIEDQEDVDVLRIAAAMLEDESRRIQPGYINKLNATLKRVEKLYPQQEAA